MCVVRIQHARTEGGVEPGGQVSRFSGFQSSVIVRPGIASGPELREAKEVRIVPNGKSGSCIEYEWTDASGTVLARSDRGAARIREGVPNLGVTPGRYLAVVRGKKRRMLVPSGVTPPPIISAMEPVTTTAGRSGSSAACARAQSGWGQCRANRA